MENLENQKRATQELLAFCAERGYDVQSISHIKACLKALESLDVREAIAEYSSVPLGGMGCFNDWIPPAVLPGETPQSASERFDGLVANWSNLMRKLI